MTGKDGLMRNVLGNHRFAQSLGRDQNDISMVIQEFQPQASIDQRSVNLLGPVPIVVGHQLESFEFGAASSSFESSLCAILVLDIDDIFEKFRWPPTLLGGQCDYIGDGIGGQGEAERAESQGEVSHGPPRCLSV